MTIKPTATNKQLQGLQNNLQKKSRLGAKNQATSSVKQKQDSVHLQNHNNTKSATYPHPRFNKND
ncbi:MAG: hypothetical protein P4N59_13720 [Negativicutes bacterium]|nr:hypothetical protein [Negativicutes bacterium]